MTIVLRDSDLEDVVTPALAVAALEQAFAHEAAERAIVPGRLNASAPGGWIRLMPAVVDANGNGESSMGFKAMNLNQGTGVRYVVLLYDAESGELRAIMDAARMTRMRTAAVTALACRAMRAEPVTELGLFGSGHEARGHAEVFKATFGELERITVFSPNADHREAFAQTLSGRLGIDVEAVADPRAAAAAPVVVLATKAVKQVVEDEWLAPGTLVLSIGSTRLDLRELDERTFARSRVCVGDAPAQLVIESGDVRAALDGGHLEQDRLVRLADVVVGTRTVDWPADDLLIFKSVGTALQDLAVAHAAHRTCAADGRGVDLGGFPVKH